MQPDSRIQWKAYPALLLAACLALGIGAAAMMPEPAFWLWIGLAVLGFGGAVAGHWQGRRRLVTLTPLAGTLAVWVVFAALGGARHAVERVHAAHHILHHAGAVGEAGAEIVLEGRLVSEPTRSPWSTRFVVEATGLRGGLPGRTGTTRASGNVQVSLRHSRWKPEQAFPEVVQGDLVVLRGTLRPPPRRRNPADFNYGGYLERQGIHATLGVYEAAGVSVRGRERDALSRLVIPLRTTLRGSLARHLPTAEARGVLEALILGDRSGLSHETKGRFARTGLMHVLAVSGLHVLLVGMIVYGLLRPFLLRAGLPWRAMEIVRTALTLTLLLAYLFVSGASASVVRAVIMTGLVMGSTLAQRSARSLNALGVAALVLLLIRPMHLFDIGFQLSFAAVAAIVTLQPVAASLLPARARTPGFVRSTTAGVVTSLAATLGTLPVLLYHFGHASFAGLLLNPVAIPLTAGTLASGLVTLLLDGWFPFAAGTFGACADLLARLLLYTATAGDDWLSWLSLHRYVTDPWAVLAMGSGLVFLAQWRRPRLRWRLLAVTLAVCGAGLGLGAASGRFVPRLDVVYFDVGHGDAALLSLPGGRHVLVDTGNRNAFSDQAERTILPHLERYGIRRLDAVVVTHPHSDHLGGLPALLRAVPVGRVIHSGAAYPSDLYAETLHLVDSLQVSYQAAASGDTLDLDPSVRVQVLSPDAELAQAEEANDASLVLRLVYGDTVFLFMGDAEAEAEQRLLARYKDILPSDVVKVGHHGSNTSSLPAFVRHAASRRGTPVFAVVSVGRHRLFKLPRPEVLARWEAQGATVRTTVAEGAVWLRSDGRRVVPVAWR